MKQDDWEMRKTALRVAMLLTLLAAVAISLVLVVVHPVVPFAAMACYLLGRANYRYHSLREGLLLTERMMEKLYGPESLQKTLKDMQEDGWIAPDAFDELTKETDDDQPPV